MRPELSLIPEVITSAVASIVIREEESRVIEVPTKLAPEPILSSGMELDVVAVRETRGEVATLTRVSTPSPTTFKASGELERVPLAATELSGAKISDSLAANMSSGAERVEPELLIVMLFAATESSPVLDRWAPIRRLSAPQEVSVEEFKNAVPAAVVPELFLMVKSRGAEISIFAPRAPAIGADFTAPCKSSAVCAAKFKEPESEGNRCVVIPS